MVLNIEYSNEREVAKNWILINGWKVNTPRVSIREIKVNYNDKKYVVIFPKDYLEKISPLTVKDESSNIVHYLTFKTDFLSNLEKNNGNLEIILKKIK